MAFATALMAAGIGMQAGGAIYGGRVAEAEGKASARMSEYNAQVAEQQAKSVELKGRFEQERQAKAARRVMGTLRARQAAAGTRIDIGTPLLVASEQGAEMELENLLIGYETQVGAARFRSQAALSRMRGKYAKMKGKAAKKASYLQAGASLLTGFATMSELGMLKSSTASRGIGTFVPSGRETHMRLSSRGIGR